MPTPFRPRDDSQAESVDTPRRWGRAAEAVWLLAVCGLAAWLRFADLTSAPAGLHGDEAITGLEGRRILAEGWIGPYSPLALGQPSGPLYLTALAVRWFGDTVLAVRVVPALLGVVTIPALYLIVRRSFGAPVAGVAAGLLAVLGWHIHFSRIGFPLIAWPLIVVLAAGALAEAMQSGSRRWWAVAGALTASGIYVYNAHPLVVAAFGLVVLHRLAGPAATVPLVALALVLLWPGPLSLLLFAGAAVVLLRSRRFADHDGVKSLLAFGLAAIVAAWPMIDFARDERNGYFEHARTYSVFDKPVWTDLDGRLHQARFVVEEYVQVWDRLCCHPAVDGVDATGSRPIVRAPLLALAGLGMAIGLRCNRRPLLLLGTLVVAIMPLAAVFTVDGMARRTFALAPFLVVFAAFGAWSSLVFAQRAPPAPRVLTTLSILAMLTLAVVQGLDDELATRRSATTAWVFAEEITDASRWLADRPPGDRIYFASDRWTINYETRRFLAPAIDGEDRSAEFGVASFTVDPALGRPVFVLLGRYLDRLPELQRRYPDGTTVVGRSDSGAITYLAYVLPEPATAS